MEACMTDDQYTFLIAWLKSVRDQAAGAVEYWLDSERGFTRAMPGEVIYQQPFIRWEVLSRLVDDLTKEREGV
jgi:hypothetical protein